MLVFLEGWMRERRERVKISKWGYFFDSEGSFPGDLEED
jgi:hypothetical protein